MHVHLQSHAKFQSLAKQFASREGKKTEQSCVGQLASQVTYAVML
jgi:hypothetical protein